MPLSSAIRCASCRHSSRAVGASDWNLGSRSSIMPSVNLRGTLPRGLESAEGGGADAEDGGARPSNVRHCATLVTMSDGVNVRDLRQNLSVHLKLVKAGRTLRVLERGRPVALLTPLPGNADALERLVSEGRAVPPRLSLAELPAPSKIRGGVTASEALRQQREED